jgi:hypothetical protein
LPQPFFGNPLKARVVVLTLNPGVGPHDYYGEYGDPPLRRALLASYRQPNRHGSFMWLDPKHSWHGGFFYWNGRLRGTIRKLAHRWNIPHSAALRRFACLFACVELFPYHSARFGIPDSILESLPSVRLARSFAREVLVPRARRRECLLIVARSAERWHISKAPNVIVYRGTETRAAFLTPESRGGRCIVRYLSNRRIAV